jgi:hypothetical protein
MRTAKPHLNLETGPPGQALSKASERIRLDDWTESNGFLVLPADPLFIVPGAHVPPGPLPNANLTG